MTAVEEVIRQRLDAVRARVCAAVERVGRKPEEVVLVGVSKRKTARELAAALRAGLAHVGENYVQEAVAKIPETLAILEGEGTPPPRWHFIGQLQRNKARQAVRWFDVIETVDRERLGVELDRRAQALGRPLEVLLQVDLSGEPQKGGVAPEALPALLEASRAWSALRVTGLMGVPAAGGPEASRPAFSRLRALRDQLRDLPGAEHLRELSMGMSADFEVAIEEGATIIRVGTAIFGPRDQGGVRA